jgi:hypothetical protein
MFIGTPTKRGAANLLGAAVCVCVLALAAWGLMSGCGDDSPSARASATPGRDDPLPRDPDATALLLTATDFPPGWTEQPNPADSDPSPLDKCEPFPPGLIGHAKTGDFSRSDAAAQIAHHVAVFDDKTRIQEEFKRNEDALKCEVSEINGGKLDSDSLRYTNAELKRTAPQPAGDQIAGYRVSFHLKSKTDSGPGSEADGILEFVFVSKGHFEFYLVTTTLDQPFDQQLLGELTQKAAAKIK